MRKGWLVALAIAMLGGASFTPVLAGCGARTDLDALGGSRSSDDPQPSDAFCESADYVSGYNDASIYILLDKSDSMNMDGKWYAATTALEAFVDDPQVEGLRVALQFYPNSDGCNPDLYAYPAVAMAPLPDNAEAIKKAIEQTTPSGSTPVVPALRGAIEYARGLLFAEPAQAVAVALVTDGAPTACNSTNEALAAIAGQGAQQAPRVLTYVIGLETGYLEPLDVIAKAGGTGAPIILDSSGLAQQLVDALKDLRDGLQLCRFNVPTVVDGVVRASDVSVRERLTPEQAWSDVSRVADCSGEGFVVDAAVQPSFVQLCPATCARVHQSDASMVNVTVGCGQGSGPLDGGGDGGSCTGAVTFGCIPGCGISGEILPVCRDGLWTCPDGYIPSNSCNECPPTPHGCCGPNQALSVAECINGAWSCPPGFSLFGEPGCVPPVACAAGLPCAGGQFCEIADDSCGQGAHHGSCQPNPDSCPAPIYDACGCDGTIYASECAAHGAGVDISRFACDNLPGHQHCGPFYCDVSTQRCRRIDDLTGGTPDAYSCIPPPACADPCDAACAVEAVCGPCPPGKNCGKSCIDEGAGLVFVCTQL